MPTAGSSPLTRGKRPCHCSLTRWLGLIPAHAGKTHPGRPPRGWRGAHPRSRGENVSIALSRSSLTGSSPLTRGKRHRHFRCRIQGRLIPAHAGKTRIRGVGADKQGAHPRSRGENLSQQAPHLRIAGSSPLTRGKRASQVAESMARRLIPAHAGKTLPDLRFYRADRSDLGKP